MRSENSALDWFEKKEKRRERARKKNMHVARKTEEQETAADPRHHFKRPHLIRVYQKSFYIFLLQVSPTFIQPRA